MIFWTFVIILILSITLNFLLTNKKYSSIIKKYYANTDALSVVSDLIFIATSIICFVLFCFIVCRHLGSTSERSANMERYTGIKYKVESGACVDEFGLLSKDVLDEVQEWNEDLAWNKSAEKDFWIGVFIPNIFDDFEFIEYDSYKEKHLHNNR